MANEQQPAKQLSAKGSARRRFTRAGAAASGVLLTVHSQPGMAAVICAGPSGFQSGLVSSRNNDPGSCVGRSPGYWKNADTAANKSYPAGANGKTLFRDVFGCTPGMSQGYGSDTCTFDYLMSTNRAFDKHNLGAHLVATYLNVLAGFIGYLTTDQVINIWNELRDYGHFTPTAGVQWNAAKTVEYLKGTMI